MTRTLAAKAKGRNARWQDEVLGRLPPKFRKELLLEMYKPQLMMCPLFLNLDLGIITRLATTLRPYLAVRNDKVFEEGEVGDEMYMIVKGEVQLDSTKYHLRLRDRHRLFICNDGPVGIPLS
eukprot:COSAG01_NODE_3121_length_6556_cov_4.914821_2_plen_122_part_00